MEERREDDFIVFDNLVQAASDIVGDNQPVKARKESGKESKYVQENASGEPYRPAGLEDVRARAQQAAERFNALFAERGIKLK
ncbi:MAG: hypothetical protein M0Z48_09965 [Nitrospiraceae bacterium]|nr:hypothetical protein [Nitrospiraceae bacterium]